IDVFERVLELRAADAVLDGEILNGLEEEGDAVDFGEFGLEAPDDVGTGNPALSEGLEVDLDAAGVERGVGAVDPDERGEALDSGISENDVGKSALALGHSGEGNVLRAFRDAEDDASVLNREEALRDVDIEKDGGDQRARGDQQRDFAESQHELER